MTTSIKTANTYVSRSHAVAARELAGEMMIMSATDSTLFSLNETATLIWNAADGKTSLRDIVENKICPEFDIEPEAAYRPESANDGYENYVPEDELDAFL